MLPSVDNLRCFVACARCLNFRAAAREVALSPAALGQRIRQLEEQVGEALFARSTRRVELTRAGRELVPVAQRALDALAECVPATRRRGAARIPTEIVLGTRYELGMSFVLPAVRALRTSRPELTIHLYFGSSTDLLVRVRSLDIDCAIGSMRVTDSRLDAIPLHREAYVLVAQPDLLAQNPLTRAEHARNHTLIDAHAELPLFAYWRDAPRGGARLSFARTLRLGTIAAIRDGVLSGDGVAVLPRYFVDHDLRAGRLAPVFPSVKPLHDHFRFVFRREDARRDLFEDLARRLRRRPLR